MSGELDSRKDFIGTHFTWGWTATTRQGVTRKRRRKRWKAQNKVY